MPKNIKSEIRKAYLLNKYVIITPGRALRPKDIREQTIISRTATCPFCPDNINKDKILDEIKDKDEWQVLCIENIFPAVSLNNEKAYGTQEVIIENRDHVKELADLSEKEIESVLRMYSRRTLAHSANKKIEYILCFKNQGSKAGASIVHAHSQVFATHILPPDIQEEFSLAQAYRVEHGNCPYCDEIKKEMKSDRKIFEDKHIAAFAPFASEFHYEAWIFTKRHLDNITKLDDKEFESFAKALKIILVKLQKLDLSFNFFLHQVKSDHDQHFYLKIQPRDSIWAGIELGSGLIINSVAPETAAEYYRK
ncbi:MAG: UDP-galactose/glucose pyrophosphorylase [Candidatus Falkowbacteria bacterium GW2011_GWC2_38_22]|uniref:UDP-galactose/glucose pyrophosphorylase n=1 Tax=Candidatus Falkowbacteria bacterium GW2011_GWE1_38_31 TaxID=1618638 RepID=A0A0G0JP77_9BACT|nr:MAG: UDP-galactose/glucose pyrophosphorylase [Candidatus Falkowbacteria bacterium GW2011_GWF2_38_1205]KKQ60412.1 MAG: UDP-galactose/glucose pyrophosphorylase [Candidatus Falkowbacteria bacterium GW2011_GWC2_38_22]KKQ62459.1 MAG: UDP-galactose/glucose pyrophosphorylase [Candidatus Falkowbacteria bacterium GW2011_GWF1_38_22]KKQ64530.1 MAG: UDP-galactose/glucose pyrophosphorylase [Candidatus Falkowbacteria bacterium GW2011_GWE2_38_254]KKQ69368.1 MAG: UDP-galactose/glucose pyrophosphorylase [Can